MFNYKNWKLYYPSMDFVPNSPVDETGNSITPDSLKKNMTIPPEEPANDLAKLLANILGADPANKVEAASELIKYLDPISKLAIPDYSEAEAGAVLKVVELPGPEVTILDADIGPDVPDSIYPGESKSYGYGKQFLDIVEDKTYFLIINGAGKTLFSTGRRNKDGTTYVTFETDGITTYTFRGNRLVVHNSSGELGTEFSMSHFTLSTPSVIKELKWSNK